MLSERYLKSVARSVGCPEMWQEDCVQEQRIGLLLAPESPGPTVARRRAIDFLRQLNGRRIKPVFCDIEDVQVGDEGMASVDRCLDYKLALSRLTPRQLEVMYGAPVSWGRRSQVRKLAREMAA